MAAPCPDVLIIGSGMGGATLAAGLAPSGAEILILERGGPVPGGPATRDARAVYQEGRFRPPESWRDADGRSFNPGNFYYVGGNSKFYGAVLIRLRREDFAAMEHSGGVSPPWPFAYEELEPWYTAAERLYRVRGTTGEDPTEPPRSAPYPHPPVPDEPAIAAVRERLRGVGLHPFSLPLGIDIDTWLAHGRTGWDGFPDTRSGKMDAETCALAVALEHPNVRLETGTRATRLRAGPRGRIAGVEVERAGRRETVTAGLVVLAAGAVNSAALLLRSADAAYPAGIANRSDMVGRHFMNHNCTALLAIDPRFTNDSIYQKTLGLNDFYLGDGKGGGPLGNVQLLGRVTGAILKSQLRRVPEALLQLLSRHAVDWYLMSEDLPDPQSRVRVDGATIVLDWRRSNMAAHARLVATVKERMRAAGFPLLLTRAFDRRTPSHQCGTVRMGTDPSSSALDPFCRAHDHPNLFVVDAGFMPSSAAVNPALTIAAQALRVAAHIKAVDLKVPRAERAEAGA
jgi:choline dehydrogenase-like flavoprotein